MYKSQTIDQRKFKEQLEELTENNLEFQTEVEERAETTDKKIQTAMDKLTEAFDKFQVIMDFNGSLETEFKRLDKEISDCGQQVEVCIK